MLCDACEVHRRNIPSIAFELARPLFCGLISGVLRMQQMSMALFDETPESLEVSPHNQKPAKNNIPSGNTHSFQHSFSPGMTLFAPDPACVAI
jgi:hypothetical protein